MFPAPREVDRYLYKGKDVMEYMNGRYVEFPAPCEVDRELYRNTMKDLRGTIKMFSVSLEVDRYLYRSSTTTWTVA